MKILSFGEILLQLAAPGYSRFLQTRNFNTSFCGAEANVVVSLANFKINSQFVTKLPNNDIGDAAINSLRYFGVSTDKIIRGCGRMGIYYLEKGVSQRPSNVIYDREYSAISLATSDEFNWKEIFNDVDWFHWTGITPALSNELAKISLDACKEAKSKGIVISCDLNYRKKLWSEEQAQSVMHKLMSYVDICIANEEDAEKMLGIKVPNNYVDDGILNKQGYEYVARNIANEFGCKYVAFTLRESYSASDNGWSGMLFDACENKCYYSKHYRIHIVDRVGAGDSFAAGIIFGLASKMNIKDVVEFAIAASCLKHSIEGDFNRVTVAEVMNLMNGNGNGRVVR